VLANRDLDRLLASIGRVSERAAILWRIEVGDSSGLRCRRTGPPLLFGRLWEEIGCRAVIEDALASRGFEARVERAVFTAVLHRIMVSGSDRACEQWMDDTDIPGVGGLALHHVYRAVAWLGKALPDDRQAIVEGLEKQLARGDKALVGSAG